MKRIVLAVSVLLILLGGATALAVLPEEVTIDTATNADANQVSYWCAAGIKIEPVGDEFLVPSPPSGWRWTLLVLKAGSDQSADPVNETFPNPVVGQTYTRTDGKSISHVILCKEPVTTTLPPPTTLPNETTTTTCPDCGINTVVITGPTTTTSTTLPPGVPNTFAVPGGTTTTTVAPTTATTVPASTIPPITNPATVITTTTPPPAATQPPGGLPATL